MRLWQIARAVLQRRVMGRKGGVGRRKRTSSWSFMAWMACSAEVCSAKVTKPKPRERPVPGSLLRGLAELAKGERKISSRLEGRSSRHDDSVDDLTELAKVLTEVISLGVPVSAIEAQRERPACIRGDERSFRRQEERAAAAGEEPTPDLASTPARSVQLDTRTDQDRFPT